MGTEQNLRDRAFGWGLARRKNSVRATPVSAFGKEFSRKRSNTSFGLAKRSSLAAGPLSVFLQTCDRNLDSQRKPAGIPARGDPKAAPIIFTGTVGCVVRIRDSKELSGKLTQPRWALGTLGRWSDIA